MRMNTKSKSTFYRHLSIVIAWILIIALSFSIRNIPSVEAGDLQGPYDILGYIDNSTNQDIPSGVTVTLTNLNTSDSGTTTTGAQGSYSANVGKDGIFHSNDGDWIAVNCSYNSEVNENFTTIDAGNQTFSWCNLTGGTRLLPQNMSINVTPWNWNIGSLGINSYSNTTNDHFNLTNQGNVNLSIKVHGENITWNGNKWNLTTTAAANNYTLTYQNSSGGGWVNIGITNSSFTSNLGYNSSYFSYTYWHKFGLNLTTPTSSSPEPTSTLSFNVTFWSIIA